MLVSEVLTQENIDVRPYRVDHKWYFARYQGDRCKKEYHDIPYELFSKMQIAPPKKPPERRTYYEYMYTKTSKFKLQHVGSRKSLLLQQICQETFYFSRR